MEIRKIQEQFSGAGNEDCKRKPAVPEAQGNMERSLGTLGEVIDALHKRIEPVLRPLEAEPTCEAKQPPSSSGEMANWMRKTTAQIDTFRTHVEDLLSHLEL